MSSQTKAVRVVTRLHQIKRSSYLFWKIIRCFRIDSKWY